MIRPCEYSICQILRTRSTPTHMNCHVLCECYAMFCLYSGEIRSNAPINGLPQDGRGGGGAQPTGNLTFSVFKCQFPHPWVSILSQIPISGAN